MFNDNDDSLFRYIPDIDRDGDRDFIDFLIIDDILQDEDESNNIDYYENEFDDENEDYGINEDYEDLDECEDNDEEESDESFEICNNDAILNNVSEELFNNGNLCDAIQDISNNDSIDMNSLDKITAKVPPKKEEAKSISPEEALKRFNEERKEFAQCCVMALCYLPAITGISWVLINSLISSYHNKNDYSHYFLVAIFVLIIAIFDIISLIVATILIKSEYKSYIIAKRSAKYLNPSVRFSKKRYL